LEYLAEYGVFLAKTVTLLVALLIAVAGITALASRQRHGGNEGHIEVKHINEKLDDLVDGLKANILSEEEYKKEQKQQKQTEKAEAKARKKGVVEVKPRLYVLDFDGDMNATAVTSLREEITAVLVMAQEKDQVLLKLESPGGVVHGYGLAASQLQRLVNKNIPLTIAVDKVAASGGYMMACIAQKIIAAPFAVIGSIGVIAQMPNFHRLLKKNDIDVELHTAGEFKRTLTMFGENTEKAREKFRDELDDVHRLFKSFVADHRSQVDIDKIATGEVWYGKRALDMQLVDEIKTSDEFLLENRENFEIFQLSYVHKKTLPEKLGLAAEASFDRVVNRWLGRLFQSRFLP
jgi:serine protease SohB